MVVISIINISNSVYFSSRDFGFDPLGLAEIPENFARYKESELIHCRWAMLAVVSVSMPLYQNFKSFDISICVCVCVCVRVYQL